MRLISVYEYPGADEILLDLLSERPKEANISHKRMPSLEDHRRFIASMPYKAWCLIDCGEIVGSVYLTDRNEIGIAIFRQHQGKGYARNAIVMMMEKHPKVKRFIANVAPGNQRSIDLFSGMNFRHIQNTYELIVP